MKAKFKNAVRKLPGKRGWAAVFLFLGAVSVTAKDSTLPKLVVHATFVRITTKNGYDLTNPRVMPDDRKAVVDVWDALQQWGKYQVVNGTSQQPELVLLVRKGRRAVATPSVGIHAGSDTKPGVTPNMNADFGSAQDMLALYEGASIDQAPLWRRLENGGLDVPQMDLVQQLRTAIEAAAKVP